MYALIRVALALASLLPSPIATLAQTETLARALAPPGAPVTASCSARNAERGVAWHRVQAARRLDREASKSVLRAIQDSLSAQAMARPDDIQTQFLYAVVLGARAEVEGGREERHQRRPEEDGVAEGRVGLAARAGADPVEGLEAQVLEPRVEARDGPGGHGPAQQAPRRALVQGAPSWSSRSRRARLPRLRPPPGRRARCWLPRPQYGRLRASRAETPHPRAGPCRRRTE